MNTTLRTITSAAAVAALLAAAGCAQTGTQTTVRPLTAQDAFPATLHPPGAMGVAPGDPCVRGGTVNCNPARSEPMR